MFFFVFCFFCSPSTSDQILFSVYIVVLCEALYNQPHAYHTHHNFLSDLVLPPRTQRLQGQYYWLLW